MLAETMRFEPNRPPCGRTRREFFWQFGSGFASLALADLLSGDGFFDRRLSAAEATGKNRSTFAPTPAHFVARAKRVVFFFMEGGPSHLDLFDPKPLVKKLAGQSLPPSFKRPLTAMGEVESPILHLPRKWKQHTRTFD